MGIPARRDLPVETPVLNVTGKNTCPCHRAIRSRRDSGRWPEGHGSVRSVKHILATANAAGNDYSSEADAHRV